MKKLTAQNIPVYTDKNGGFFDLRHASPELRRDRDVVMGEATYKIELLDYASSELLHDPEFLRELYWRWSFQDLCYGDVGSESTLWTYFVRNAPEATEILCANSGLELSRRSWYPYDAHCFPVGSELTKDWGGSNLSREQKLEALRENGLRLNYSGLEDDREAVLIAVAQNGFALNYADASLRSDREIVLTAVRRNGLALQFAPDFWNDRQMALEAIWENARRLLGKPEPWDVEELPPDDGVCVEDRPEHYALQFVSMSLRNDKDFMLAVLKIYPDYIVFASEDLKSDREFMLEAMRHSHPGSILRGAASWLLLDREFLMEAIRLDPGFDWHRPQLTGDDELMEAGRNIQRERHPHMKDNPMLKKYYSRENLTDAQLGDRMFLMTVLRVFPFLLDDLPQPMQEDHDVILAALRGGYYPGWLDWNREDIRDDPRIVLEAVMQDVSYYYLATARAAADPVVSDYVNAVWC